MAARLVPDGYKSKMGIIETEVAIKLVRTYFEEQICEALNLTRVSAPLVVMPETGLNDNLNEIERAVSFDILEQNGKHAEIVQSLAKWKRFALGKYGFEEGQGLYTNMNALRRDEVTDNIHSIYVDQWDWELVIPKADRTIETLKAVVTKIYKAMTDTEDFVCTKYPFIEKILPKEIFFVTSQEMEDAYPNIEGSERENIYAKKHKAIFVMQIGAPLKSGMPHDGRAADYDDWQLNGDIVLYYPVLDRAFEISSMGIRVDENSLRQQLTERNRLEKLELPFQKSIINCELPYTIGGGIGQSRLCMFMLRKAHIGEVQSSIWRKNTIEEAEELGVNLL